MNRIISYDPAKVAELVKKKILLRILLLMALRIL